MTKSSPDDEFLRAILGQRNTATVSIRGDSLIAIAVGVMCAFLVALALTASVSAVTIVAIWRAADIETARAERSTDLRDMAQIRARLMQLEQYREQHTRRLNELERTRAEGEE